MNSCLLCSTPLLPTNDNPEGWCAECQLVARSGLEPAPERWRRIPTKPAWDVSDRGAVRRRDTGAVVNVDHSGRYPRVSLGGERCRIHTLVLRAFVGPRGEGEVALHHDDDPENNRLGNLSWGSAELNSVDAKRNRPPRQHAGTEETRDTA